MLSSDIVYLLIRVPTGVKHQLKFLIRGLGSVSAFQHTSATNHRCKEMGRERRDGGGHDLLGDPFREGALGAAENPVGWLVTVAGQMRQNLHWCGAAFARTWLLEIHGALPATGGSALVSQPPAPRQSRCR